MAYICSPKSPPLTMIVIKHIETVIIVLIMLLLSNSVIIANLDFRLSVHLQGFNLNYDLNIMI
jgi:hypothetical protein